MRSWAERIVADDRRSRDAVDDLGDHVLLGDGGEAVADDAAVGLDLDEARRERGLAVGADQLDVERNVERRGGDAGDFHGAFSGKACPALIGVDAGFPKKMRPSKETIKLRGQPVWDQ